MSQQKDVLAAGAVVTRKDQHVLLVHRPRYDDWSFPKGKLEPGEHPTTACVREVAEETGVEIRLGPPLRSQRYEADVGRMKTVHYWVGRVVGDDDVSSYVANHEIDQVAWVPYADALDILTYPYDRETLGESSLLPKKTRALIVLRHGRAHPRKEWRDDDRRRPLTETGTLQALRLVPILAAYDVSVLVSSSSTRCVETVTPYADATGTPLATYDALSEEDATVAGVNDLVDELLAREEASVLCTHRPVLPLVFDRLGQGGVQLDPGGMLVVHHRKLQVIATELYGLI